ncbi:MAG: HEAT repeat domain-containing protein [Myxococcales bacterium]|nr:HEAT repeat domain-containing protein [Myxococcales bacterium]
MKRPLYLALVTLILASCSVERDVQKLFERDENAKLSQPVKASELARLGSRAIPPLQMALRSNKARRRELALAALGRLKATSALDSMAALRSDPAPEVRRALALAMGEIGGPKARTIALELLSDNDAAVRAGAIWSLGTIGTPSEIRAVLTTFKRGPKVVYQMAVWALARLCKGRVPNELVDLLDGESTELRVATVELLDLLGHAAARSRVESTALSDSEEDDVRRLALIFLGRHGDFGSLRVFLRFSLASVDEVRMTVYYGLGLRKGSLAAAALLLRGLDEPDEWRRDVVTQTLIELVGKDFRSEKKAYRSFLLGTAAKRITAEGHDERQLDALAARALLGDDQALTRLFALAPTLDRRHLAAVLEVALHAPTKKPKDEALARLAATLPKGALRSLFESLSQSDAAKDLPRLVSLGLRSADAAIVKPALAAFRRSTSAIESTWLDALEIPTRRPELTPSVVQALLAVGRSKAARLVSLLDKKLKRSKDKDQRELYLTLVAQLDPRAESAEAILLRELQRGPDEIRRIVLTLARGFGRKLGLARAALRYLDSENTRLAAAALLLLKAATGKNHPKNDKEAWEKELAAP